MHTYNIGYHTYEESEYIQIAHKKQYSPKKFGELVKKAILKILKGNQIKKEEKVTFQNILHEVIEVLIKDFGFKEIKFDAEFNVFGWTDILNKKDWEYDRSKELDGLADYLNKNLNIK